MSTDVQTGQVENRVRTGFDNLRTPSGNSGSAGLVIRQKKPEKLEFPFEQLDSLITPNTQFFIRCHFVQPNLQLDSWRLRIEGEVNRPLELNFSQFPFHELSAT